MDLDLTAAGTVQVFSWNRIKQRIFNSLGSQPSFLPIFAAASLTIVLFALTPATTRLAATQIDGLSIGLIRSVGAGVLALPLLALLRLAPPKKGSGLDSTAFLGFRQLCSLSGPIQPWHAENLGLSCRPNHGRYATVCRMYWHGT